VAVTFNVTVPAGTPVTSTVYIVGNQAAFCNWCGEDLGAPRPGKRNADVAHPIGPAAREQLELAVIEAYQAKLREAA